MGVLQYITCHLYLKKYPGYPLINKSYKSLPSSLFKRTIKCFMKDIAGLDNCAFMLA